MSKSISSTFRKIIGSKTAPPLSATQDEEIIYSHVGNVFFSVDGLEIYGKESQIYPADSSN